MKCLIKTIHLPILVFLYTQYIYIVDANLPQKLLITSQDELERILHHSDYDAFELLPISQEVVQVQVRKNKGYEAISRKTNVVTLKTYNKLEICNEKR